MLFEGQIHDFRAWLPWNREKKEKRALRAIIEQRRRVLSKEQVAKDSAAILEQIEQFLRIGFLELFLTHDVTLTIVRTIDTVVL